MTDMLSEHLQWRTNRSYKPFFIEKELRNCFELGLVEKTEFGIALRNLEKKLCKELLINQ